MRTRTHDLVRFGVLGAATLALQYWFEGLWWDLANRLMERDHLIFDELPEWMRMLGRAVDVFPWLICAALLVLAIGRRRWVPLIAFAGVQLLGIVVLLGVFFGRPIVEDYASRRPFDSASWKAENSHAAEGLRVHMVDDLLEKHGLVGMDRPQLENLLGVPPQTEYFRDYDYVYWLGPQRGAFSSDSEWLVIKCSKEVVVSAQVVTD